MFISNRVNAIDAIETGKIPSQLSVITIDSQPLCLEISSKLTNYLFLNYNDEQGYRLYKHQFTSLQALYRTCACKIHLVQDLCWCLYTRCTAHVSLFTSLQAANSLSCQLYTSLYPIYKLVTCSVQV